jgi:hypothetical protein
MKRTAKAQVSREKFPHHKNMRMAEEDVGRLEWLAGRWRCSESAVVRRALEEAERAEKVR